MNIALVMYTETNTLPVEIGNFVEQLFSGDHSAGEVSDKPVAAALVDMTRFLASVAFCHIASGEFLGTPCVALTLDAAVVSDIYVGFLQAYDEAVVDTRSVSLEEIRGTVPNE